MFVDAMGDLLNQIFRFWKILGFYGSSADMMKKLEFTAYKQ